MVDDAEFEDALDCLPEELGDLGQPQEAGDQIEEQKASADEIHRLSVMLYNDFSGTSSKDLIHKFRSSRASDAEQEDIPIFKGKFHLKKSKISLINDSKIKDLSQSGLDGSDVYFKNQEYNEILMFSNGFSINYSHFDAQDLDVKHQVKINASCKEAGVQIIQKFVSEANDGGRESYVASNSDESEQTKI
jgi:hypothetical protein